MSKYDRYWDVHLTASTGWYDFAGSIGDQAKYQLQAHSEQRGNGTNLIKRPASCPQGGNIVPVEPDGFEQSDTGLGSGYVASAVKILDVHNAKVDANIATIVKWISDKKHTGKIRFNAHGDPGGGGYIFMGTHQKDDPNRKLEIALAGDLASWLIANGLEQPEKGYLRTNASSGLKTINLCICYSSKDRDSGVMSGVDQVIKVLTDKGYLGIEVTGIGHPAAMRPSRELVEEIVAATGGDASKIDEIMTESYGNSKAGQSGYTDNGQWKRLAHSADKVRKVSKGWTSLF